MTTQTKKQTAARREEDAHAAVWRLLHEELDWDHALSDAENFRQRVRIWRRLERLASVGHAEALAAAREAEEREA